jgi:hypothetical protein
VVEIYLSSCAACCNAMNGGRVSSYQAREQVSGHTVAPLAIESLCTQPSKVARRF